MHFKASACIYSVIFIVVSLPAIVLCRLVASQEEFHAEDNSFEVSKLFDYENYKRTFGKSYSSELENSSRRCYFYARAMSVFVSGVNYKFRTTDYYNALNDMSDWAPEERAKATNKRRHAMTTRSMARLEVTKPLPFMPAKGEEPEETLRKFLEKSNNSKIRNLLNELNFNQTPNSKEIRRLAKRDVLSDRFEEPRNFSFDKLINGADDQGPMVESEQEVPIEDRNPDYEGIELATRGINDQIEDVELKVVVGEPVESQESLESQLESAMSSLKLTTKDELDSQEASKSDQIEKDQIFIDHSQLGCMSPIRHQGQCGSCYAFASIAIIEWLYCKKKGSLVEFSEQYMIDCGNKRIEDMFGCDGASDHAVAKFVHNFGVELRRHYPYRGNVDLCPYDDSTELSSTGYIRVELGAYAEIPISLWAETLKEAPLYVLIQLFDAFYDYGGGVYDGAQCQHDPDMTADYHAVVLVGHGREEGQEYWLIRNSHGQHWGERGYYKLSKRAPKSCILEQLAYALGSKNGHDFKVRPYRNRRHNEEIVASGGLGRGRRRRKHRD